MSAMINLRGKNEYQCVKPISKPRKVSKKEF